MNGEAKEGDAELSAPPEPTKDKAVELRAFRRNRPPTSAKGPLL